MCSHCLSISGQVSYLGRWMEFSAYLHSCLLGITQAKFIFTRSVQKKKKKTQFVFLLILFYFSKSGYILRELDLQKNLGLQIFYFVGPLKILPFNATTKQLWNQCLQYMKKKTA